MSVFFFISGGIKAPTGHEEEEAGDVKDTNWMSEGNAAHNLAFPPFSHLHFLIIVIHLPGFNKPSGEEPGDETWGKGQHHEDSEGVNWEDHTAAEWNEPYSCLSGVPHQTKPQPAQNKDWCKFADIWKLIKCSDLDMVPLDVCICVSRRRKSCWMPN